MVGQTWQHQELQRRLAQPFDSPAVQRSRIRHGLHIPRLLGDRVLRAWLRWRCELLQGCCWHRLFRRSRLWLWWSSRDGRRRRYRHGLLRQPVILGVPGYSCGDSDHDAPDQPLTSARWAMFLLQGWSQIMVSHAFPFNAVHPTIAVGDATILARLQSMTKPEAHWLQAMQPVSPYAALNRGNAPPRHWPPASRHTPLPR